MTDRPEKPRLFPALLKYWRGRRGMSQLDLALSADVSSRHVSFLETGRASPSEGMVLRLAAALTVPLREQNEMLRAAGFESLFEEPSLDAHDDPAIAMALERMLSQQEPFPMFVMDRSYRLLKTNHSAQRIMTHFIADPSAITFPLNGMEMLFDPLLTRNFIVDWERAAVEMLARLNREALEHPEDSRLSDLLARLLAYPDVPQEFHEPDFRHGRAATATVCMRRDDIELNFLGTITSFSAPQNVTLEELRIESYFPLDKATERHCQDFAGS